MLDRRCFLATCSKLGLASTLFPGALWALAQEKEKITEAMIEQAAVIADVTIPADDREMMVSLLNEHAEGFEEIYKLHIPNSVAPALLFDPVLPGTSLPATKKPIRISAAPAAAARGVPRNLEDVAFWPARALAELVRTRRVSSTALTAMYLERLHRYDPLLKFVITFTEDRARAQAREADRDIAAGRYRGPLHGLPWGAKDLLAVKGYPTTWGAGGFEKQSFDEDATVVKRLDAAGAVLAAKLTLGALAMNDGWFGGKTRNPWQPAQGSSGSSAGSSSATAAGCVAFSLGSETLGSIASPSTRCGCTGLRPTFGRVPRTGAMALAWSMDKLGPICRSVEDCALVLDAIAGPDGHDRTVQRVAFNWDAALNWKRLRIGYLKSEFELRPPEKPSAPVPGESAEEKKEREEREQRREQDRIRREYDHRFLDAALAKLAAMGVKLEPVELPKLPFGAIATLLEAEAAAAFDELTRSGRDALLTGQGPDDWPNLFRSARLIPAVEYVQANRARTLAMEGVAKAFAGFDAIVAPSLAEQLTVTNLTGHPAVIVPNGFRGDDAPPPTRDDKGEIEGGYGGPGTPVSLTFLGQLYGEARLLAFARAYQDTTGFHRKHPALSA